MASRRILITGANSGEIALRPRSACFFSALHPHRLLPHIIRARGIGIGFEAARQLLERGHHLALACRSAQRAENTAAALQLSAGSSGSVWPLVCDLSRLESVRAAAATVLQRWNTLDVVVCNAGRRCIPAQKQDSRDPLPLPACHPCLSCPSPSLPCCCFSYSYITVTSQKRTQP